MLRELADDLDLRAVGIASAAAALGALGYLALLRDPDPRIAVALVVVVALRAHAILRSSAIARTWIGHVAGTLAAFVLALALRNLDSARVSPTWPWMVLPLLVTARALCVQPIAGLSLLVGASAAGAYDAGYWAEPLVLIAFPALLVHAIRNESWRLPLTWAAGGLALTLACEALYFDHMSVGSIGGHLLYPRTGAALGARLTAEATILIATRYLLLGRTWALFAIVVACFALALSPAPGYSYYRFMTCMGPWFHHPLDRPSGEFLPIAFVLVGIWAAPIARWLRHDRAAP